jgi:TRAP-type C4-dicarboxylate transport system permease large subunit
VIDRRYLWIVNNFLHDMATGVWAACVLVVWMLFTRRAGMPAEAASAIGEAMSALLRLALAALVIIGATGGVRLGYWRRQADAAELAQKRRALLVKHAAFAVIYGGGTVWLWSLIR